MLSLLFGIALATRQEESFVPYAGTTQAFQKTVYEVASLTEQKKFAEAAAEMENLPDNSITMHTNYDGVPKNLLADYQKGVADAIKFWQKVIPDLKFTDSSNPDLLVSFVQSLPKDMESGLPQGLVIFTGYGPKEPRIEAVIAMNRMDPPVTAESSFIRNDIAYAIGEFLGLARSPKMGSVMFRTDGLINLPLAIAGSEKWLVQQNLDLVRRMHAAIEAKEVIVANPPEAYIDLDKLDVGVINQGDVPITRFEVFNRGKAPLKYSVVPDCSCFGLSYEGLVPPGQSRIVTVGMDSTMFPGKQHKGLFVYTNDPNLPVKKLDFYADVKPFAEIINLSKEEIIYLDEVGEKVSFLVLYDEKKPFALTDAALAGVNSETVFTPWSGKLDGSETVRKGYKVTSLLDGGSLTGRTMASLKLTTDNEKFGVIIHNITIQRGVAAMPPSLYLGEIANLPMRAWFILSQPGRPFKITDLKVDNKHLAVTSEPLPNGDIKIVVAYDGKASIGSVVGTVTIKTDQKDQPEIYVPVHGVVK